MLITSFGSASSEEIEAFELRNSVKLPADYSEFLKKYNGGIVKKEEASSIYLEELHIEIMIDVLYGFNTGSDASNINNWNDKYKDEMVENAIIIGDDLFHGFIVMICEGENSGIYYWDDSYHFDESSDVENTYWITDHFRDFIKGCSD